MVHEPDRFLTDEELNNLLVRASSALLVVDMQNDNVSPDGRLAAAGVDIRPVRDLVPQIVSILRLARGAQVPVFHSRTVTLPGGASDSVAWRRVKRRVVVEADFCLKDSWGAEFHPDCAPCGREPVIEKHRSSAFHGTDLALLLRAQGVETLVIVGEQTPGCIEATFRDASQHDFVGVLVEDCVAAYDPHLHECALVLQRARGDVCRLSDIESRWLPRESPPTSGA